MRTSHLKTGVVKYGQVSNTSLERRAAARAVAEHSTDLDDCRELLAMLGLLDDMPAAS